MSYQHIIRAWKDVEYRLSLSAAERALLPGHPAGLIELSERDMDPIAGGGCDSIAACTCNGCSIQESFCVQCPCAACEQTANTW